MGFQFVHLESWSRKADDKGRSTTFIFDEASRRPGASVHVENPEPPTIVYGVGVEEVREMHDAAAAAAVTPGARGKLRKIASTQKTLHTVIASHPYTVEEVRGDPKKAEEIRDWERRTVSWLKNQYGPALKSVVRHTDERQWHIHAFILPSHDPEMRAAVYHPGVAAKRAVKASGRRPDEDGKALNKRADAAYKAAMREWQDSYHEAVALPCGLTRLGPARRRLTRDEWKAEQAQAKALKNGIERAKLLQQQGATYIKRAKQEVAAIQAEAAEVKVTVERLKGFGGAVRALTEGLRESQIRAQIRREFARDLHAAQAIATKNQQAIERERNARRRAEKESLEARHQLRQANARAASTQAEVRRLSTALAAALNEPEPKQGMEP
jgi:hypothetical protein